MHRTGTSKGNVVKAAKPAADANDTMGIRNLPDPLQLDLSELVGLIAAGHPPPWLADFLGLFVPCLVMNRFVSNRAPSRRELSEKLNGIRKAAKVLLTALQDDDLQMLLDASQLGVAAPREGFRRQLQLILEAAEKEISPLQRPDGKLKAGAGHAFINATFSPEVECAVLIAESWRFVRGDYPPPRNRNAHSAADLLWVMAGGKRRVGADNPLETWRQHFKHAVGDPVTQALEDYRCEVRRRLADAAHIHASLTEENTDEIVSI